MLRSTITDSELQAVFKELAAGSPTGARAAEELRHVIQDLQVYKMELESQNQALRQSQEELEFSTRRYTDLYDFSPIGYLTLTKTGQIEDANITAAEMLQMERPRLIGRHFRRFLDDPDQLRFFRHLEEALAQNSATLDVRLRTGDQATPLEVQLSSRLAALNAPDSKIRMAITDVSELKRVQYELQEVNREQESFCHSISHDLRSPLVTISNFSSLLLREFGTEMSEEAKHCAERIQGSAMRMDQLLSDLLSYTQISRASLIFKPVALDAVVDDVIQQFQGRIELAQAEIEVQRPLGFVNGSTEALGQVVANLISNAMKFTKGNQRPRVQISASNIGNRIVLAVRDEGIGIAAEYVDRIFGMFERLHGVGQYPGTGVGLAIVKRAVDRMSGRIWVESISGQGSTFFVELPSA